MAKKDKKSSAQKGTGTKSKSLYFVNPGYDPEQTGGKKRLIFAFAGGGQKFAGRNPFEFFLESGLAKEPILLIKDPSRTCLMRGCPPDYDSFEDLLAYFKEFIAGHPHDELLITGTSAGGFSALLFGHLLSADKVVSFSPYTYISKEKFMEESDPAYERALKYIDLSSTDEATYSACLKYMDLKPLLSTWNGKTVYDIHVSKDSEWDFHRANYLAGCPNVTIHPHPYDTHGLVRMLMEDKKVSQCFA